MKKSLVALTAAGLAVSSIAQAAPQANTFYVGAKAGWASFHDGIKQLDSKYQEGRFGINKNSVAYGILGGYQINNHLAAEVGYEYFGRLRGTEKAADNTDKTTFKHTAHGTTIALKASYPLIANLDAYAKAGVALVNNRYKTVNIHTAKVAKTTRFKTSFLAVAGMEYAITPNLAANVEYQWVNNTGKASQALLNRIDASDYRPDIGSVFAGLTYRFGQSAQVVSNPTTVVTKKFSFSSDVLFDFGKADLREASAAALDSAHNEIQKLGLASPNIQVDGYTDRIGKEASNLALSQRRADTVANYLTSKGVDAANIKAVGYGAANPVTGNTCDVIKGRQALISCLAPDRRVEISVKGSKRIEL